MGNRRIEFKDGGVITHDYPMDKIYGLFIGTFGQQTMKKVTFRDEANNISATLEYGAYMFKKQDYCWGEIKVGGGKVESVIEGNYVGYLNFDGVRYWDFRNKQVHTPVQ